MKTLIVRHVDQSDPAQFQVVRLPDGKTVGPLVVPSPVGFPVVGRPNSDLMRELRWYLEGFLDYPYHPETDHAERLRDALKAWGQQAFLALFGDRATGRLFDAATNEQYGQLQLRISSDDPRVLYWPWEALRDPEAGVLARTCQVQRQLNRLRDPHPLSDQLPRDRVNILLVTARPFDADVRYRSISRPLVDQIDALRLPASVTVLRPPTFDALRDHLRQRPNYYHILHFDGHGAYGAALGHPHPYALQGLQGQLVFEDEQGRPDPQTAEVLSELLRDCSVPVVVLNACQSAMVDERAEDAFASVAAGLDEKIQALIDAFREHRFLIVWENFEVVYGIPRTSVAATLSADDRQRLPGFLRGGQSTFERVFSSCSFAATQGERGRKRLKHGDP